MELGKMIDTAPAWVDPSYRGRLVVEGSLYKNKWTAQFGMIFGRYVRRFFVLDLQTRTFSFFADSSRQKGCVYDFSVLLLWCLHEVGNNARRRHAAHQGLSCRFCPRIYSGDDLAAVLPVRRHAKG